MEIYWQGFSTWQTANFVWSGFMCWTKLAGYWMRGHVYKHLCTVVVSPRDQWEFAHSICCTIWHVYTHTHTGVNCGPPESPAQGATNYTSTEYGAEAKYSCNAGYILSGASVAVCNLDGTWSRPPPTCSSKLRAGPLASLRRPLFVTGFLK